MMFRPSNLQWWMLVVGALMIVFVWPPSEDRSLALKFVNWAVDPRGVLPVLPARLELGLGDDPDAVYYNDLQTQQYDTLYLKGGWTRKRLELKVAGDPFNPSTERQILLAIGVLAVLVVWRFAGGQTKSARL